MATRNGITALAAMLTACSLYLSLLVTELISAREFAAIS